MATKRPNTNSKRKSSKTATAESALPQRKESIYLICGLVSLVIAGFTTISFISYIFTWAEDQSLFANSDIFTLIDVENDGGALGLMWANLLITKLFGLGAFVIPIFFFGLFSFCLKIHKINIAKLFFASIFGSILLSLAFSYLFTFFNMDNWFGSSAGGSYGYYVIEWMKKMVGTAGCGLILALLIVIWLIIINKNFVERFNRWIEALAVKLGKLFNKKEKPQPIESENDESVTENPFSTEEFSLQNSQLESEFEEDKPVILDPDSFLDDDFIIEPNSSTAEQVDDEFEILSTPSAPVENKSSNEVVKKDEADVTEEFAGEYTESELNTLFDPRLDLSSYKAPPLSLLEDYKNRWYEVSRDELEKNKRQIVTTLANYKIGVSKVSARIGPTVTLYEIVPAPGVRVSQIKRLEEDIQLSLAAKGVRVVTLVGTNSIGIEVANEKPSTVSMLSVLDDAKFQENDYDLPVALGKTITGDVMHFDLAKMPHLLVAGATGQGKSVGLNAILASLLYTKHPSEMKLVLVDPKKVELSLYSKLEKHFLAKLPDGDEPVITDTQKVVYTLKSLCQEMDDRYMLLKQASVRHLKEYNEKFLQRKLNPLKGHRFMPYIVVVIDEFADLLMTAGKEIEEPIARLAQLARAIGIHLVIATQRPTTSVITGNIKANFPARIAFMVRSSIDSRTILDQTGANQLIGRGDMLISTGGDVVRVQCAFIDTKEVERVVDFIGDQRGYTTAHYLPEYTGDDKPEEGNSVGEVDLNRRDPLFEDAAKLIVMNQQGSTSLIQRKMNLGYNRAGRIIDQLEVAGVVGPFEGSKARQVLISDLSELDTKLSYIRDIYG